MPKITVPEDCGNAPKKEFIRDFNIAFIKNDLEAILDAMTDDIEWELVGDTVRTGKEEVREFMKGMPVSKGTELTILTIITHGNTAASNGTMKFEDGSEIAFCDIYEFSGHDKNARIIKLASYGVDLKQK